MMRTGFEDGKINHQKLTDKARMMWGLATELRIGYHPICCIAQPLIISRVVQINHNLFADILLSLDSQHPLLIFMIISTNNEEIMCPKLNICSSLGL
ncbi:MAG: hypothetical protein Ct9H300mP4_13730 [Gammaproteobacteria bacterium]|nr:MAG: hypothetical protein Ct9H300mP4_13730 [Gammaproteobacteria bacterium]